MRVGTSAVEQARLATLDRYGILDSEPEQAFDDLASLAAVVCDASAAQINFIDAERQWTKASVGLPCESVPREESICAIAINRAEMLVVEDLATDERLRKLVHMLGDGLLRFYAGVPLVTPDGHEVLSAALPIEALGIETWARMHGAQRAGQLG